ncbi:MAG TPA: 1-acyl-sn-glycerol-3-phosphate acyltransferase [Thermoleophilaceae bacterium]|jgi:1-acyl-sn-glycerol-3-phosphate acyltransferase
MPSSAPARDLSVYHERTRTRGVNPLVYWLVRAVLQPLMLIYFRVSRVGREHVPRKGGLILAPNHRSFLDPFVIGICIRRPAYFMAKQELFNRRLQAWVLNSLGAYPVRRGEADEDAMETSRMLVERGEMVLVFPEGTRIRKGSLGKPKRGVGRLALETGAPVVPIAVTGSENARRGWKVRPAKVKIRLGRPLTFPRVETPSPRLAAEVTARIWPCVELQWEWLGGLPPLRKAAIVGAGSMGTALATLLARAGIEVQLGCRIQPTADRINEERENERLPGVELPDEVKVSTVAEIEFGGVDLVCFAVPSRDLPAAVAQVGARVGERSALLVLSKGLVPPLGATPTHYVGERIPARAVGALGGPAHAAEAVTLGASVVLASSDADFRAQFSKILGDAGLDVETTDDVTGAELAACAKNAAALAAAAAATSGMNAAGAAASRVFAETHRLALASGGRTETFMGLAGTGDLVGTVLAEHSRNRRAGEMLGRGVPADQIAGLLEETPESLDAVPLLVRAFEAAGLEAPATADLGALIDGRLGPEEWVASVRARKAGGRWRERAAAGSRG